MDPQIPHLTERPRAPEELFTPYVAVTIDDLVVPLTLGTYQRDGAGYRVSSHFAFGPRTAASPDEARRTLAALAHAELTRLLPLLAREGGLPASPRPVAEPSARPDACAAAPAPSAAVPPPAGEAATAPRASFFRKAGR